MAISELMLLTLEQLFSMLKTHQKNVIKICEYFFWIWRAFNWFLRKTIITKRHISRFEYNSCPQRKMEKL